MTNVCFPHIYFCQLMHNHLLDSLVSAVVVSFLHPQRYWKEETNNYY